MDEILGKIVKFILRSLLGIIKKVFSIIFSVLFGSFVILILIFAIAFGMQEEKTIIKDKTYLVMNFENSFGSEEKKDFFNKILGKKYDFYSVLKGIEKAEKDSRIKGIILDTDKFNLASAYMEELDSKLQEFKKSGKKIIAYGSNYSNRNYRIALSADEIIMPPSQSTSFHLTAYYTAIPYFKNIADKIGVKYNVITIGDYKSFGENYVRDEISPEFRSELERVLDRKYEDFKKLISQRRNFEKEKLDMGFENGEFVLLSAVDAFEKGFVDKTAYFEDEFSKVNKANFYNYISLNEKEDKELEKKADNVALIYMNGEIITRDINERGFVRSNNITPSSFSRDFEKAVEDDSVKGIILRIDSPGGSPLASEIISNMIEKASNKKPIYVSMGSVAASGGYYIASNAKKIFLDNETITGSIGVVSLIPNFYELSQKVGLDISVISKGKYAGIYDISKETSPEELELIKGKMQKIYEEFKSRVSKGRDLSLDSVEEIAQGRIWTGEEAVERGLADGVGGLEYSIKRMAKNLGLEDYGVISYREKTDIISMFKKGEFSKIENILYKEKTIYSLLENDYRYLMYGKEPLALMPYNFE